MLFVVLIPDVIIFSCVQANRNIPLIVRIQYFRLVKKNIDRVWIFTWAIISS